MYWNRKYDTYKQFLQESRKITTQENIFCRKEIDKTQDCTKEVHVPSEHEPL